MATALDETTRLSRHGEKLSIEITPAMLAELGVDENAVLRISSGGITLVVSPFNPEEQAKFKAAVANTFERYGDMFKRLAVAAGNLDKTAATAFFQQHVKSS